MAELTNLETKLGEVIGLAMAAQAATRSVAKLARAGKRPGLVESLNKMHGEAKEAELDAKRRNSRTRSDRSNPGD